MEGRHMAGPLGERFVRALAAKDFAQVASLLHPEVDFRGMTPGRFWQANTATQAYYETSDGLITWMRVLCSGFRPVAAGGTG
jgi:hypothetical protein